MNRSMRVLRALLLLSGLLWVGAPVLAAPANSSYEAPLPVQLVSGPDLCGYAPCRDVMPAADRFSQRKGHPAYVEAYTGSTLVGYVFLSTDIVDIPAYSGKPVVTLIGMDAKGTIIGIKILRHSEPILLVGIPESELTKFIRQFVGKHAWDKVEVGRARAEGGYLGIDAISGATVTVIAENQVVMRSAYLVAREVGIVAAEKKPRAAFTVDQPLMDWPTMVSEGSVQRLAVSAADVGDTDTREPLIEMYFGYLNTPAIGQSVLGKDAWERLMARLKPDEHAIFIVASGRTTFKGSGFVRGGIFDRVQVSQDMDTYTFRDTDYLNLYGIAAAGAPSYTESSVFIIRNASFSAAYPWSLVFLANKMDPRTGAKTFANFDREYWLPDHYLVGGRPQVEKPEAPWVQVWRGRAVAIALFAALLVAVAALYANRDRLTRRASRRRKWPLDAVKYTAWAASVGFFGFYLMAQPSVTQVLTWFHSLLFHWTWELFLSDPFIFLFWIFIAITVFVWGRGLFCGWLCPFGSLTEILYKIGGHLGLGRLQFHLPKPWHDRLKWTKYFLFFGLLVVSFFSMSMAERLAEVEPFKTTFLVGLFNRSWPYTLFAASLLGLSIFVERPFCKYLCPLGASLAMPTTFRWFGLRRKQECNTCAACAAGCGSLAIDANGRIDQRECLLCLDCMVMYTDAHACPPLVQERKRRERAGREPGRIGDVGYFIPVLNIDEPARPVALSSDVDPRMATDPVELPWASQPSWPAFVAAELRDHLWPFRRSGFARRRVLHTAAVATLFGAGVVLYLAVTDRIAAAAVIGAWVGWSFFEVSVRLDSLPYVKEGPWWQRRYRVATLMDMLSYVGFKNLLIGAAIFLFLKSLGLLAL